MGKSTKRQREQREKDLANQVTVGETLALYMHRIARMFPTEHVSLVIREPSGCGDAFFSDDPGGHDAIIGALERIKNDATAKTVILDNHPSKATH